MCRAQRDASPVFCLKRNIHVLVNLAQVGPAHARQISDTETNNDTFDRVRISSASLECGTHVVLWRSVQAFRRGKTRRPLSKSWSRQNDGGQRTAFHRQPLVAEHYHFEFMQHLYPHLTLLQRTRRSQLFWKVGEPVGWVTT